MMRFYGAAADIGERECGVIASTRNLGRDGMVVEPSGIDLTSYRRNPIVLFNHSPDSCVGTTTAIGVDKGDLAARIQFAPEGASALADQICSLVKAGVVQGVSIGFDPKESQPLDPQRPRGGQRITRAELLEISFVAIPADYGARVVQRSFGNSAALFRALPAIPRPFVQRAAARLSHVARPAVVSPTMHCWMLLEQRRRDHEAFFSLEARKAAALRLRCD